MISVIVAALENEGLLVNPSDIKDIKFVRQTSSTTHGAIYHAIVYDDNEDIFSVCNIFLNYETLGADFGGCPMFEGTYDECVEYFNE